MEPSNARRDGFTFTCMEVPSALVIFTVSPAVNPSALRSLGLISASPFGQTSFIAALHCDIEPEWNLSIPGIKYIVGSSASGP